MNMRRVVITVVSLAAVLVHAHVGCCAHHDHALATASCPLGHHHYEDGSHHDHDLPPADPLPHEDCHETHCFATLVNSVAAPAASGVGSWLPVFGVGNELTSGAALCNPTAQPADPTRPLPLRAHLRWGVLLI